MNYTKEQLAEERARLAAAHFNIPGAPVDEASRAYFDARLKEYWKVSRVGASFAVSRKERGQLLLAVSVWNDQRCAAIRKTRSGQDMKFPAGAFATDFE